MSAPNKFAEAKARATAPAVVVPSTPTPAAAFTPALFTDLELLMLRRTLRDAENELCPKMLEGAIRRAAK